MIIEFTSTECIRPEIMARSYESFHRNLTGVDWGACKLYLNVDPIPATGDQAAVIETAKRFFGTVEARTPQKANFAEAIKWVWAQPTADRFFHLEADWLLTAPVKMEDLMFMLNDDSLSCINLRAYPNIHNKRLCLSPCLLRTAVAKSLAAAMNTVDNPEAQLRPPTFRPGGRSLAVSYISKHWPNKPIIKDIGRAWLKSSGMKLPGSNFVAWQVGR